MKFRCDSCDAQYAIADEKVGDRGVKVRCKRCSNVIIVRPDGVDAAATEEPEQENSALEVSSEASGNSQEDGPTEIMTQMPQLASVDDESAHQFDGLDEQTSLTDMAQGATAVAPPPSVDDNSQDGNSQDGNFQDGQATHVFDAPAMGDLDRPLSEVANLGASSADVSEEGDAPPPPADEEAGGDALDDEIAGAFSEMFAGGADAPPEDDDDDDDDDDPFADTRVLDQAAMDQLRQESGAADAPAQDAGFSPDSGFGDLSAAAEKPEEGEPVDEEIEWFAAIDDEQVGPLAFSELQEYVDSGQLDPEALVWHAELVDWLPAEDVPEVAALFRSMALPRIASPGMDRLSSAASSMLNDAPELDSVDSPFDAQNDPFAAGPTDGAGWQPHGLTEVYQAANLAEAAAAGDFGKLGGEIAGDDGLGDDDGGGWRPGAASALASLVANELDGEPGAGGEPDTLNPAESNLFEPPPTPNISGELPLPTDPGVTADIAPPNLAIPPPTIGFANSLPPTSAGMSQKMIMMLVAAGSILAVLVVVAALKVILEPAPSTIPPKLGPNQEEPVTPPTANTIEEKLAKAETAPVEETNPAEPTAIETTTSGAVEPIGTEPPNEDAKLLAKADPPKTTKPKPRKSSSKSSTKKKPRKSENRKLAAGGDKRYGGCDPVLDLNCNPKKKRSSSSSKRKRSLSKSDVLIVVRKNKKSVDRCAAKHGVKGKVKASWIISGSGRTSSVKLVSPAKVKASAGGKCITKAIRKWRFPKHSGDPLPIKFPFKF